MKKLFYVLILLSILIVSCVPVQENVNKTKQTENITKNVSNVVKEKSEIESKSNDVKSAVKEAAENKNKKIKTEETGKLKTEKTKETESSEKEAIEKAELEKLKEQKKVINEFLANAPKKYWFYEEGSHDYDGSVFVFLNKRSTGEYDTDADNLFWDADSKIVHIFVSEIPEAWWFNYTGHREKIERSLGASKYFPAFLEIQLTGDRKEDNEILTLDFIKKIFYVEDPNDRTKLVKPIYVKGPVDWLEEYKNETPIKIDSSPFYVKIEDLQFVSNLSVYYKSKDNPKQTVIFRFDNKFKLPLVIDILEGSSIVKKHKFVFKTKKFDNKKMKSINITEDFVSLPEDAKIISPEDAAAYIDYIRS